LAIGEAVSGDRRKKFEYSPALSTQVAAALA
jgi:hypothetical protein